MYHIEQIDQYLFLTFVVVVFHARGIRHRGIALAWLGDAVACDSMWNVRLRPCLPIATA
jgi:hypothetical protein